jgi:hypothetical protein
MQTFGGGPLQHNVGDEGSTDGMEGGGGTHADIRRWTVAAQRRGRGECGWHGRRGGDTLSTTFGNNAEHWVGLGETTEG